MPVESLTYVALAERLGCSPEAARALAKRLRLPRQKANDGKALVIVDLAEIDHKPLPAGHRLVTSRPRRHRAAVRFAFETRADAEAAATHAQEVVKKAIASTDL